MIFLLCGVCGCVLHVVHDAVCDWIGALRERVNMNCGFFRRLCSDVLALGAHPSRFCCIVHLGVLVFIINFTYSEPLISSKENL